MECGADSALGALSRCPRSPARHCSAADSASAQGEPQLEPCPGGGYNPTPTVVEVAAVPIVVESATTDYFVLYVSHEVDADTTVDIPVLVKQGEAGTTTLAENVEALPAERYRVEKYQVADPADVDGDCIDDIAELADPAGMNPVNPAALSRSEPALWPFPIGKHSRSSPTSRGTSSSFCSAWTPTAQVSTSRTPRRTRHMIPSWIP